MKKNKFLVLLTIVVLQSCALKQRQISSNLSGKWILESLNGNPVNRIQVPSLEFRPAENKVYGSAGCNRISGPIQLSANTIKFGSIISTKMACPAIEVENSFLRIISDQELSFRISGTELTLSNGKDKLLFRKAGMEQ